MQLTHTAYLPWCCYDRYSKKIVIRIAAPKTVRAISIICGDPFDYGQDGWHCGEFPLYRQLDGGERVIWRAELDVPPKRRLKYAFRVENEDGAYYFSEYGVSPYSPAEPRKQYNHFIFPYAHDIDAPHIPQWAQNTVWYQIFPERFYNGDPAISPPRIENWETGEPDSRAFFGGDLEGVRVKLAYLRDMGVNGIYFTPVFESPSNHKYDTQDYFAIDTHFGTTETLKKLVQEAHALGIRVMLDAVFNHIGAAHPFWRDVIEKQEKSAYKDYFHIYRFPVKEHYQRGEDTGYETFAFAAGMPKWNTENPQARKYLLEVAAHWIRECDIDGWRLDVANEVSFDFWKAFRKTVDAAKDDFYVVGEIWHDSSPWLFSGCFDAVMNYPAGFAIRDFFLKKELSPRAFTDRLFTALSRYDDAHNRAAFNLLDSHDTPRALSVAGGDKNALKNAFTMLFLLPGAPCVYYGDEVGMDGGNDPLCRKPMVWDEARRDTDLLAFFRSLVSFRTEYAAALNNGVVRYEEDGGIHCWRFSGSGKTFSAVYAEDAAPVAALAARYGSPILRGEELRDGALPPMTLAVYAE
jgi:glycosidase